MHRLIKSLSDWHKQVPPYTVSLAWWVIILLLCWLPKSTIQEPSWFHFPNADKVVHFTLFFVWAFCLQADANKKKVTKNKILILVLSLGIFTAVLTEVLQPVVSNRTKDVVDGLVDVLGIVVGWIISNTHFRSNSF